MSAPTKPNFFAHQIALSILRRRSVYRPGVTADEIQRHIQWLIEEMTADGYPREVIHALLTHHADIAVREAAEHNCNTHRAAFFHDLVYLELEQ